MAQGVWRGVRARARAPPPALCSVAQRTESAPLAPDTRTRSTSQQAAAKACSEEGAQLERESMRFERESVRGRARRPSTREKEARADGGM